MQIIVTEGVGARVRSAPTFADNIISVAPKGKIFNADDAAVPDWYAILDLPAPAYMHHSVSAIYTPPPPPAPLKNVPYKSQWGSNASRQSDCGPTCCAMLSTWKGIPKTPDDFRIADDSKGHTTAAQLAANLGTVGLKAEVALLDEGVMPDLPAICLVYYGGFDRAKVQDTAFTGLHWLILLSYDDDEVTVHDPDWWAPCESCGDRKHFTRAEFARAFVPYTDGVKREAVILSK